MCSDVILLGGHCLDLTRDLLQRFSGLHLKDIGWRVTGSGRSAAIRLRASAHLLPEVLQHVLATPPQVGLQQHRVALLIMHGLGDLAAQEPEEKMADAFALRGGSGKKRGKKK